MDTLPLVNKNNIRTNQATRYFRISRVAAHTLFGLFVVTLMFPVGTKHFKLGLIKWWCTHLLDIFNVSVISLGHSPPSYKTASNHMIIANHISWVDIHAINSILPLTFLAKSDIKSWPVFGYLVSKGNAIFLERGKRHHATRIVDITTRSLKAGDNLCLFPEGTTTDGTAIMPFKGSVIQSAIDAHSIIWPVAIRYPRTDGSINTEVAYAGDTTMAQSIQQVLLQKNPVIELHFLAPIVTAELADQDKNRRDLTRYIQSLITKKLAL
ncbi:MAG: 1-acyl-sn-glycerol-3-phosphate acyltransferase [Methylotenera sp.]|nr:1-acyl-sn-glycerol-3-phosphate acyltransferase [Methylotenera sp.]MSP99384.1 1-acyl-sn-glycerol-3-phosphate acyltransferase [Methylotenera sp.]